MWGEDGIVVSLIVATVVMGIALLAGFVLFDGIAMWAMVALVIGAWLVIVGLLGKRYESGRWPFGKADPWQGQQPSFAWASVRECPLSRVHSER